MADFSGRHLSKSFGLAILMAVVSSIVVGILGTLYLLVSSVPQLLKDFSLLIYGIPIAVGLVFAPILANFLGIALAAIVMPIALGIWPRLRFYNLLLAACFTINPLIWRAIGSTASGPDAYHISAATEVLTIVSAASVLSAAICGLFYRRMEQVM